VTGLLQLSFDPLASIGGLVLRWDALALVGVLMLAIGVWVLRLRTALSQTLRFDDVCFVLLGAIPGAVVGGRMVHVLDYLDVYLVRPGTVLDLGRGSASLVGAVIGGALSAAYICRLLGGKVGVWADAASVPALLAIGLGKLALLLGAGGLGAATNGPLAVSYVGPGPWRSTDALVPAYPSQALEGIWALLGIPVVLVMERIVRGNGRAGGGITFLTALAWWLGGRAVVAVTWRDDHVAGPVGAEGVATLVALSVVMASIGLAWRAPDRAAIRGAPSAGPGATGTGGP
jgi:prolipoprotein diacylglyceryltransferase